MLCFRCKAYKCAVFIQNNVISTLKTDLLISISHGSDVEAPKLNSDQLHNFMFYKNIPLMAASFFGSNILLLLASVKLLVVRVFPLKMASTVFNVNGIGSFEVPLTLLKILAGILTPCSGDPICSSAKKCLNTFTWVKTNMKLNAHIIPWGLMAL